MAPFLLLQGPEEGRCHQGQGTPPFRAAPGPQVAAHLRSISGEQAAEWWSLEVLNNVPEGGREWTPLAGAPSVGPSLGLPPAWAPYPGPTAAPGACPAGRGLGSG